MRFNYTAYDGHGAKVSGEINSDSAAIAKQEIASKGLILVKIETVRQQGSGISFAFGSKKVSLNELEFITSELAILLKSGVRIDRGLEILQKGASSAQCAELLSKLLTSVRSGKSVSEAFSECSDIFDQLYINMLKLGEASGELDVIFLRLAADIKFRRELRAKIIQSLTYPLVILFVSVLCVLFVFNYIVPQMSSIFDRSADLPSYTLLLLDLSEWFINYQWFLFAGLAVGAVLFSRAMKTTSFRMKVNQVMLNFPLLGKLVRLTERIRFNSSMAMMLSSGVSIVEALTLSAGNIKNSELQSQLMIIANKVKQGSMLSTTLIESDLYSEFDISLVEVGEESGELTPVFDEIANRSRTDFEGWTATVTSMLEPLLILTMGAIVGSVVVVMLMSIVSTNDVGI